MWALLSGPKLIHLPVVAHIAGFTLGATTVDEFEATHKHGHVRVGGHSNSGRGWYVADRGWAIDADGFNFWNGQEIIDYVSISPQKPTKAPKIHLKASELGLLGIIHFGESHASVEQAIGQKVSKDWNVFPGLIRYRERPVNMDTRTYTKWNVHFGFDADKLVVIQLRAD